MPDLRKGAPRGRETIAWSAVVRGKLLVFAVSREALEALTETPDLSPSECLSALKFHRDPLQQAAELAVVRDRRNANGIYLITPDDVVASR